MEGTWTSGWRALAAAGLASVAAPVMAAIGVNMPAEQYQGRVGFVTGGVGRAEAKLFEQQATRHPLAIELLEHAGKSNEFTADAMVKISDQHGRTVLDAKADGPFMLVDLAPGRYSVGATLNNETLKKSSVMVARHKTARAIFEFGAPRLAGPYRAERREVADAGLGG
jgi:hypothetical protein